MQKTELPRELFERKQKRTQFIAKLLVRACQKVVIRKVIQRMKADEIVQKMYKIQHPEQQQSISSLFSSPFSMPQSNPQQSLQQHQNPLSNNIANPNNPNSNDSFMMPNARKMAQEERRRQEQEKFKQKRAEIEKQDAERQNRKLNFLVTQTELYGHFMANKSQNDQKQKKSKKKEEGEEDTNMENDENDGNENKKVIENDNVAGGPKKLILKLHLQGQDKSIAIPNSNGNVEKNVTTTTPNSSNPNHVVSLTTLNVDDTAKLSEIAKQNAEIAAQAQFKQNSLFDKEIAQFKKASGVVSSNNNNNTEEEE